MKLEKGMVVKYADGWCTDNEKDFLFVILDNYDDVRKCKIGCLNSPLALGYVETVSYDMIVPA